jgi:hydrogenase expression/formation protein HypE
MMAHGSGGMMSQELIEDIFRTAWNNQYLNQMLDGAIIEMPAGRLAMTTDSFVITPIVFPGGNIGKLSICGTVNDLVACGARPLYLSVGMIIEEGMEIDELKLLVESMAQTAQEAGVFLVTGDTKVVEKGSADRIFINTTGIGVIPPGVDYGPHRIQAGDRIIVTGTVGDHGLAILAQREGLSFRTPAESDCAPLHQIGQRMLAYSGEVRCMRDPTRGGLATVLNELASQSGRGMMIRESKIPVSPVVQGACDMLGMDPLYMANEGKMVVVVGPDKAEEMLEQIRGVEQGVHAAIIGTVQSDPPGMVLIETELGASRILGTLEGEHLPRIC